MSTVLSEPSGSSGGTVYEEGAGAKAIEGRSPGQLFWRRFRKDKFAIAGLVVLFIMLVAAVFAPVSQSEILTGHQQDDVDVRGALDEFGIPIGPNGDYWFGADDSGRDLFVQVVFGARTSLIIALLATGIAVVIGVTVGLVSGFYRGKIDTALSRFTDLVMSLPIFLLALGLVAACGGTGDAEARQGCLGGAIKPGLLLVAYVIGLFSWPYIARIVRGQVLSIREKEFIESARAIGMSDFRIMTREVLPNLVAPIIVYTTLIIPNNILFEAALSFLGLGVPATTPSWGKMLSDAGQTFTYAPWMMIFPGTALLLTTLAFNLVGDGLRDALDPRSNR